MEQVKAEPVAWVRELVAEGLWHRKRKALDLPAEYLPSSRTDFMDEAATIVSNATPQPAAVDERTAAMDALTADSADMIDVPASADAMGDVAERLAVSFSDKAILRLNVDEDSPVLSAIIDEMRVELTAALSAMSPAGAEQRGYDRAIAEVVAWLRVQQHGRTSDTFPGYYARAIEAGEHKP